MALGLTRRIALKGVLFVVVWTLIGLAFASQYNFTQSRRGYIVTWEFALITALADWYLFALLSIPALWLSRRFRLEGARWRSHLLIHFVASGAFAFLWVVLRVMVEKLRVSNQGQTFYFDVVFHWTLVRSIYFNLLVYWIILGVSHAFDFYQKYRERQVHALELEKLLAQSRLEALQAQLNPHFLFNTLHAISALMHQNIDAADRMIARLSDLLRAALESTETQEVSLREEVDFLRKYLEIEQTRFGERLKVQMEISSDTWDVRVPNLILQPLVENAIKHGIEPKAKPGVVALNVRCDGERLCIEVRDNGVGIADKAALLEGVGLSNTRARLRHLYGDGHTFELRDADGGGLAVCLSMPLRRESAGPPEQTTRRSRAERQQSLS